jgi:hypothetical protein
LFISPQSSGRFERFLTNGIEMKKSIDHSGHQEVLDLPDLTPKQFAFVQGLLEGKTASDAYRGAYDCSNMSKESIWARASELRRNSKVAVWLTHTRMAALELGIRSLEQHVAQLTRLREEAIDQGQISAAVQAEVAIGRVCGLYEDKIRVTTQASDKDLVNVIRGSLGDDIASQIAKALGIEVAPDSDSQAGSVH